MGVAATVTVAKAFFAVGAEFDIPPYPKERFE